MSLKWRSTAGPMGIVRSSAPSFAASFAALPRVRRLVPKPGIVTAQMKGGGSPSSTHVFAQTRSASVESSPPETPTTSRFAPVCSMRLASPAVWMLKISWQRSDRTAASEGTKGRGASRAWRRSGDSGAAGSGTRVTVAADAASLKLVQ